MSFSSKYSPIYLALIASGVLSTSALANDCTIPTEISNAQASLANCNIQTDTINSSYTHYYNALYYLSNSTVTVDQFSLQQTISESQSSANIYLISPSQTQLTINNSQLEIKGYGQEDLSVAILNSEDNSNITINNSTLKVDNAYGDVIRLNKSTLNANNTRLTSSGDVSSIISLEYGSQATLNNSTLSTDHLYSSAFSYFDKNNRLTINNSSINAENELIASWWGSSSSVSYADLNLTVNNSDITSKIIVLGAFVDDPEEDDTNNTDDTFNLVATNSNLTGLISTSSIDKYKTTYNVTLTDSTLTLPTYFHSEDQLRITNSITNLKLSNSAVILPKENEFQTLTITDELSGSGTFHLNTDLANQQSDQLILQGKSSGDFNLAVSDSGNEPNSANGKVTLVQATDASTANFKLTNNYVDAGAYRYFLTQDGNNWVLSNTSTANTTTPNTTTENTTSNTSTDTAQSNSTTNNLTDTTNTTQTTNTTVPNTDVGTTNITANTTTQPITPTPPTQTITPPAPTNTNTLSAISNNLASLRQAQLLLVESSLVGLHDRLGEIKQGEKSNVWVRNINSRNELDATQTSSNSYSSGFKQDLHLIQLGADVAVTDNLRLGGFVGNTHSNVDFNGNYGSGDVDAVSFGLYGTYLANNGFYWDNIAKYERISSKSDKIDKQKYNAYSLSTEIGRIHQIGSWAITPQIQATWTTISGHDNEQRLSAITGRVGVRVDKSFAVSNWSLQPYAELHGVISKNNDSHIRVNQYQFDVESSKNRLETAVGLNAAFGNHRVGIEGKITHGKYLDQPYNIQAVYRYQW
ncbi:autotransporter outer membrane beta-barrel domain-containing protein [Lonepinella sp. BR2474]|uniref:autotransporter outer membrane beta-barrel domain-containing protein n=1 Tax=Lonepinella sp. BR2474 TaxID=3434548 RepID=UPI003F6E125D